MNFIQPGWLFVIKSTVLLAGLWLSYFLFVRSNPRWQVWAVRIGSVGILLLAFTTLTPPILKFTIALPTEPADLAFGVSNNNSLPVTSAIDDQSSLSGSNTPANSLGHRLELPQPKTSSSEMQRTFATPNPATSSNLTSSSQNLPWRWIAIAVWFLGAFASTFYWVAGWLRLRAVVKMADDADETTQKLACDLANRMGIRPPRVMLSDAVISPSVVGLVRSIVLLPKHVEFRLNDAELHSALAHELAHIAGGDLQWNAFVRTIVATLWPHPLLWMLPSAHRSACERASDLVAADLLNDRRSYAEHLLSIAVRVSNGPKYGLSMARSPEILSRLKILASEIRARRLGRVGKLTGLAFVGGVLALGTTAVIGMAEPITQDNLATKKANVVVDEVGIGKSDAPPNRIKGQVLFLDGQPAARSKVQFRGLKMTGIDASATADDQGNFEVILRCAASVLPNLQVIATSQDGQQSAFHRFDWDDRQRVVEGFKIELESLRTLAVQVTNVQNAPVESTNVVFQARWPHTLTGVTNAAGIATVSLPGSERIESVAAWKDHEGLDYKFYALPRDRVADVKAVRPEFPSDQPEHLVLEGTRPLTLQFANTEGRELEGVSVYPSKLKKSTESYDLNLSLLIDHVLQVTDVQGETTLAWFPNWQQTPITLLPQATGYESTRIRFDPATVKQPVGVTLNRLVPVRGLVLNAEGKPASDILIKAVGQGRSFNEFRRTARTDSNGRYELELAPNQIYLLTVETEQWAAAPQTGFAVFPDSPLEDRNFKLRSPTRVYGRLLNEQTQEPVPHERVSVYQNGKGLHEMPNVELPNPWNENHTVRPVESHYAITNERGEFEFLLGEGEFDIQPPQQGKSQKFSIIDQPEIEIELTTKILPDLNLVGLVVDNTSSVPIAEATVIGVPRRTWRDWQASTDEDGKFLVRRRDEATFVHAYNSDRSLGAIVELGESKKSILIELEAVGSARGRLVDETNRPVAGQKLQYGIDVPSLDNQSWTIQFGGTTVTDERGNFELSGLVASWQYKVRLPPTPQGVVPQLSKLQVTSGERRDLGDLQIPLHARPHKQPTILELIHSSFEVKGTPLVRFDRALEATRLFNQQLLIVFGVPDDPSIVSLMKLRFEDPDFGEFGDEFRIMAIPTDTNGADAAAALAEKLDEKLPKDGSVFRIVICDSVGKKVASAAADDLSKDGRFSRDQFYELLRNHIPQPLIARRLLEDSLGRASRENKRLIIQETATWCAPCQQLSRWLDANRVWEKDYIWVKMDHRWIGAEEVMGEIRDGAKGGIPWIAILDSDGKKLATSNSLESGDNIGYPSAPEARKHFSHMLNSTRQRMSEADVQSLIDAIDRM